MRTILLIMIGVSSFLSADFSRDSEGVVKDSNTGLFWQDNYADNESNIKQAIWSDAISYCEASTLGGRDDWRLPNKKELLSIVDYSIYNPSISSVFQNITSYNYWSSTTSASYTNYAWLVYFYNGFTSNYYKSYSRYVRCVRAGQ
jgi:hypothetical protein